MYIHKEVVALVSSAAMNIKWSIFGFLQTGCKIPWDIRNMGGKHYSEPLGDASEMAAEGETIFF